MEITKNQAITAFKALTQSVNFTNEVNKYAASRNIKKLKATTENIEEFTQEKRLEHCFKDKDECPVKDEKGNMKFKPAQEKEFSKAIKAHMEEKIEFEPYQFRSNPEMLSLKYIFINSDLEFLLDESLLAEPSEVKLKAISANGEE